MEENEIRDLLDARVPVCERICAAAGDAVLL